MGKDNSKLFILILLGMLTAFGPFVTDMYLPSLPSMGEYFSTSSSMVQLGLTTSMIGLAVGQIFFGPLSDRYGRRIPLQVAMWLFIVSTMFCLFAREFIRSNGTGYNNTARPGNALYQPESNELLNILRKQTEHR